MMHAVIAAGLVLSATTSVAADGSVIIITSGNSRYQNSIAESIRDNLGDNYDEVSIIPGSGLKSDNRQDDSVYVTIGRANAEKFYASKIEAPVLHITDKTIDTYTKHPSSQLLLAQHRCREVALIKSANDKWKDIAILSSIHSLDKATELTKCAIRHNINLSIYAISDMKDLARTLGDAVEDNDAILAVADSLIYNRHTIKNILLTSYRSRRPIIGYSKSFVDAGAITGIYASTESVGRQATEIIDNFIFNDRKFERDIYYPDDFSIKINHQVARSLDIVLPAEPVLKRLILNLEDDR